MKNIKNKLFLRNNVAYALTYKVHLEYDDIKYISNYEEICLDEYNLIFFRPDPPVDIDYINACNVFLSFITQILPKTPTYYIKNTGMRQDGFLNLAQI